MLAKSAPRIEQETIDRIAAEQWRLERVEIFFLVELVEDPLDKRFLVGRFVTHAPRELQRAWIPVLRHARVVRPRKIGQLAVQAKSRM